MEKVVLTLSEIKVSATVDGSGQPVLLLHGFPDSTNLWKGVTPYLVAAGFKTIAFDQRGFGDSDAPPNKEAYSFEKIASDACEVLKALDIREKVCLVGHDWGSFIGWYLCLTHPELFSSFVAVSVGHPYAYKNAGPAQWLKGWYIWIFQIPGLAEWIFSANDYKLLRELPDKFDQLRVQEFSRPGRLTASLNWYRANFSKMFRTRFGKNSVPTMGVYSNDDVALTRKQMVDSQKYMAAKWKYLEINNSSHWIPLDQPEVLAQSLIDWFRSTSD